MRKFLCTFRRDERGATAIEYGLIAAGISVVIIAAVTTIGGSVKGTFDGISKSMTDASFTTSTTTDEPR